MMAPDGIVRAPIRSEEGSGCHGPFEDPAWQSVARVPRGTEIGEVPV